MNTTDTPRFQITEVPTERLTLHQRDKLISIIVDSQDGKPRKDITRHVQDGRLLGVTDNLNRLLADAINNAVESRDIDTMIQDLRYAREQIAAAICAVESEVVDMHIRTDEIGGTRRTRNFFVTL